jgi:hypothetical protein
MKNNLLKSDTMEINYEVLEQNIRIELLSEDDSQLNKYGAF